MLSILSLYRKSSKFSKWTQTVLRNLPLNPKQLKRQFSEMKVEPPKKVAKACQQHNTPHPSKDPPDNYKPKSFDHEGFTAPNFLSFSIFRQLESRTEKLGPGAHKACAYKNPEYFCYHRYSFAELQMNTVELAKENASLRCIYDYEKNDEDNGDKDSKPTKKK